MRISDWSSDVCSSDLIEQIEAQGTLEVQLSGRSFRISRDFIEDIRSQPQLERIGKLRKALLVFHSPVDTTVGVENAAQIFAAAKHPKSFVRSEEHTSELQSLMRISYAVFCLKKKSESTNTTILIKIIHI